MVELEALNEYRFYKLEAIFPQRCTNFVDDIYNTEQRICGGILTLHMVDGSINMICNRVGCFKQYDIIRDMENLLIGNP